MITVKRVFCLLKTLGDVMQCNYIRGSSSISRLEEHICFKVKYCHNVFDFVEFKDRCKQMLFEVAEKEKLLITEIGFERNHVHMTWQMKIYHSVSGLAKTLKGTSGKKLLKEFPEIKKKYFWGSGLWSGTIYCDSIGKDATKMKDYVRNQGVSKKHQKTLKDFAMWAWYIPISGWHATSLWLVVRNRNIIVLTLFIKLVNIWCKWWTN